jgi:hypothetical protein
VKSYPDIEQGSPEWFRLRFGKVTASELNNLLTPQFELRKGEMPYTYLCTKLAESWRGQPLPGFTSFDTEQGEILQDEALPWYQFTFDKKVKYCGFIENDDGTAGCSPDGLIGEDNGIEIKCPAAHTHVKYLMAGGVPKDYLCQVHGSMFVTGFPRWTFLSYRRGFPQLLVEVERSEAIISRIGEAIAKFHVDFAAGRKKIEEMNGK